MARIENFSKSLFWDADINSIDLEKHQKYITERVLCRGSLEDFKLLLSIYGKDQVKKNVKSSNNLDKKTLSFCRSFFHIPIEDFKCYKRKQSNPTHWNY